MTQRLANEETIADVGYADSYIKQKLEIEKNRMETCLKEGIIKTKNIDMYKEKVILVMNSIK